MPLFAGIAGPSGAGKSTLARLLQERMPGQVSIVALDWYYLSLCHLPPDEREATNFDHPDAIDWERFFDDFMALESGKSVEAPVYDFCTHARRAEVRRVEALPVVLIEGLHALWQPALRAMLNFRIYIEASQSVCLKRRIERDTAERGRKASAVIRQFKTHTSPMFVEFIAPTRNFADIVLNGELDFSAEVESLSRRLM